MSFNTSSLNVEAIKVNLQSGSSGKEVFMVAAESPITININGRYLQTIIASPSMLTELAIGHLYTEGIIDSIDEVRDVNVKGMIVNVFLYKEVDLKIASSTLSRVIRTGCGDLNADFPSLLNRVKRFKVSSNTKFNLTLLLKAIAKLSEIGTLYKATHATHSAVIVNSEGKLVSSAEDVGRHNAVDKAVGEAILKRIKLSECLLLCSGRLTVDMALKAARAGLPIAASLSAPTSWGIKVAEKTGLTLVEVRGKVLTIYTHPERLNV